MILSFVHWYIYFLQEQGKKKDSQSSRGETPMSHKDAAMFPFFASAALLSLYSIFQVRREKSLVRIVE